MKMQLFGADPLTMLLLGMGIAIVFVSAASRIRPSSSPRYDKDDEISSMVGNRVDQITTGRIQEFTPAHLVSIEEEIEERQRDDV